jgi:hypothetical protein
MILLLAAGVSLLIGAPMIARIVAGRGSDPVGLTRVLQLVAVALLIAAIFARPYNPDTAAIPPPPDSPPQQPR